VKRRNETTNGNTVTSSTISDLYNSIAGIKKLQHDK
jgi:hypothetical protein